MKKNDINRWGLKGLFTSFMAFFVLVLFSVAAFAQTETGQIVGTVKDANGAVIPGATIEVKNLATTAVRTTTANDEGFYIVSNLLPGTYQVTASSGNFKPASVKVQLTVGGRSDASITLTTGVEATVDVTTGGGIAEINTQTQDVGNVVTNQQITELPTLNRNPYGLVGLSGNVSTNDPSGRGAGVSINGLRSASTNVLLDGVDNSDAFTATIGQGVPLDSVDQFRVITSTFSAEYGRATAGVVNVTTKSGSNDYHGTIYAFNRNSKLASNDFDNNANDVARGVFNRNQFGYSVGGRIIRDKLFFFNSTEWTRVRSTGDAQQWVLTPAFLGLTPGAGGVPAGFAGIKNFFSTFGALSPSARATGRIVTAGQIAAAGAASYGALPATLPVLQQVNYSLPQDLGAGAPQNSYQTVSRIDWNVSDKLQIYGRYAIESGDFFDGTTSSSPYSAYNTGTTVFNQSVLLSGTYSPTAKFTSQTKINYNRLRVDQPLGPSGSVPALYLVNGNANGFLTSVLNGQSIVFPGYLPTSPNTGIPFGGPQNFFQFYEDASYTFGNHTLRFGGQYVYLQDNRTFGAYQTANQLLSTSASGYTTAFNNLLSGNIARLQVAIDAGGLFPGDPFPSGFTIKSPNFSRSNLYNEFALYFSDNYRVLPRLNLNLGIRYEYYGVQHNKNPDLDSNFYYGSGSNIFEQIANGRADLAKNHGGLWNPDKNNFAPRLGFAWDVFGDGKTSVRGGYAVAFERNFGNVTFNVIQNPPNYAVVTVDGGTPIQNTNLPVLSPAATCAANNRFCVGRPLPPSSMRWVDENIVNAYAHQWSIGFQREIARSTTVSVEYTGSAGRKLYSLEDPNRLESAIRYRGLNGSLSTTALATANRCPAGYFTPPAASGTLSYFSTVSRINCRFTNLNRRGNGGYSDYNGLVVSVESNNFLNTGLVFTSRYTYGVAKDNLSSTFSESANNFNLGLLDPFNPSLDYGYADFDTRHRWVGSFIYEVPFGKNMSSWKKHVFSGWELAGTASIESGAPFTVFDCFNGFFNCRRLVPTSLSTLSFDAPSRLIGTGGRNQFTYIDLSGQMAGTSIPQAPAGTNTGDPCAFGIPNGLCVDDSSTFEDGMTARNAFRGPGFWNVDLGVYKRFRITERYSIQFRGEIFNVFNHANLFVNSGSADILNGNITASKFGSRNIQLAVKFIF
jgi:hypothetical protein